MGIDPNESKVGDVVVEVAHSGFYTRVQVWLKVIDGAGGGYRPPSYRPVSTSPPTLRRVAPDLAKRQASIPRLGDIWIPKSAISPNHFVRLYIPRVEDLYQEGGWRFQQESTDEQKFNIVPSIFERVKPIHGVQSKFDGLLGPCLFLFQGSGLSCKQGRRFWFIFITSIFYLKIRV